MSQSVSQSMLKDDDPLPTGANRLLISFWRTLMKKQDPLLLTLLCDRQKTVTVHSHRNVEAPLLVQDAPFAQWCRTASLVVCEFFFFCAIGTSANRLAASANYCYSMSEIHCSRLPHSGRWWYCVASWPTNGAG